VIFFNLIFLQAFPEILWDIKRFGVNNELKSQNLLFRIMRSVFPSQHILYNYHCKSVKFKRSNQFMSLDIFLPEIKLALEYQGKGHFEHWWSYGDMAEDGLKKQKERDEEKKRAFKSSKPHTFCYHF